MKQKIRAWFCHFLIFQFLHVVSELVYPTTCIFNFLTSPFLFLHQTFRILCALHKSLNIKLKFCQLTPDQPLFCCSVTCLKHINNSQCHSFTACWLWNRTQTRRYMIQVLLQVFFTVMFQECQFPRISTTYYTLH